MALELAEIAAGLPFAASFAVAGGFSALREGRRRTSLNAAVHELRRPLQALALAAPDELEDDFAVDSSLRMAAAALERLEAEINGGSPGGDVGPVRVRALVETSARRWRPRAALAGRALRVSWEGRDRLLEGDECALAQMLDNLITNGLRHGCGEVVVKAAEDGDRLVLAVLDSGCRSGGRGGPGGSREPRRRGGRRLASLPERLGGRRRHGHGLKVVARTAAEHGGSFELRREESGTRAVLELPLLPEGAER